MLQYIISEGMLCFINSVMNSGLGWRSGSAVVVYIPRIVQTILDLSLKNRIMTLTEIFPLVGSKKREKKAKLLPIPGHLLY